MYKERYYEVKKRTLAEALNFLGFRYYKFGKEKVIYGFENTEKFREALTKITELKNQFN